MCGLLCPWAWGLAEPSPCWDWQSPWKGDAFLCQDQVANFFERESPLPPQEMVCEVQRGSGLPVFWMQRSCGALLKLPSLGTRLPPGRLHPREPALSKCPIYAALVSTGRGGMLITQPSVSLAACPLPRPQCTLSILPRPARWARPSHSFANALGTQSPCGERGLAGQLLCIESVLCLAPMRRHRVEGPVHTDSHGAPSLEL